MKITPELLKKVRAYRQWFDVLKKYPNGIELIELLQDSELDLDDLYFARHYFYFNTDELEVYNNRCQIQNCGDHVLRSSAITNSNWIYNSKNISNSNFISNCENVNNSNEIKSGINVIESVHVINSKNVKYSQNVADSSDIFTSNNIINSNQITWSNIINSSSKLEECGFCYKCQDLNNCYFCGFTENSKYCLFCNNISDAEYQIFNKPVSPLEFAQTKEKLLYQLEAEIVNLINIDETKHLDARFSYDLRFDRMFEQLSEDFYGWVGSLPQYDEQIFLLLFFTSLK